MRSSSQLSSVFLCLALCVSTVIFTPVMSALPPTAGNGGLTSTKLDSANNTGPPISAKAAGGPLGDTGTKSLGATTGKTASGEVCTCGGPEPTPTPPTPPKPDIKSPDSGYPTPAPPVDSGAGSFLSLLSSQTKLSCVVINLIGGMLVLYA